MRQSIKRSPRRKWASLPIFCMCTLCLLLLVGGYILYQQSIEDAVSSTTRSYMEQMAEHDIRNVGSQVESRLDYLHALGNRMQLLREKEQIDISYLLNVDAQASQFKKLYLITDQGDVYDSSYLVSTLDQLPGQYEPRNTHAAQWHYRAALSDASKPGGQG